MSHTPSPNEMLELINTQARQSRNQMDRTLMVIVGTWALSWLIGFSAMWSGETIGGNPWFRIPDAAAAIIFAASIIAGIIISAIAGSLTGRGIRGPSAITGRYYGLSWPIAMTALGCLIGALTMHGLRGDLAAITIPGMFIFTVGLLYLGGGAAFRSGTQFVLGVLMILLVVIASFAGSPAHYLLYATVGPALLLCFMFYLRIGTTRSNKTIADEGN